LELPLHLTVVVMSQR